MAIQTSVVTVLTTPTLLAAALGATVEDQRTVLLTNASVAMFIGGINVTVANGFPVPVGPAVIRLEMGPGDSVFGIVAADTATINVLTTR